MKYDVVVAGGSIAGLLCAREIARRNHSVLVVEKSHEIGTPEHCGGVVSASALDSLQVGHRERYVRNSIHVAKVFSPGGTSVNIDATPYNVVEINRRELDKQIAQDAQDAGVHIRTKTEFKSFDSGVLKTSVGQTDCRMLVNATGITSLITKKIRDGVVISAQAEIAADWIKKGEIQIFLDGTKYPGFFAWSVASEDGRGKVGVAGKEIDATRTLTSLLDSYGNYAELRRINAPIWVGGPIKRFVDADTVSVGDAAGQTKPTTAGGILSCGMGGIMAGRAIADWLDSGNRNALDSYQKSWTDMFGSEFTMQLAARSILRALENDEIDALMSKVTPHFDGTNPSFDFHVSSIVKMIGVRLLMRLANRIPRADLARLVASAGLGQARSKDIKSS